MATAPDNVFVYTEGAEVPDDDPLLMELESQMKGTHPLMGIMYEIAQEAPGGVRGMMRDFRDDNPNGYLKVMFGFVPNVAPVSGVQGEVHLHVHQTLAPTALDAPPE